MRRPGRDTGCGAAVRNGGDVPAAACNAVRVGPGGQACTPGPNLQHGSATPAACRQSGTTPGCGEPASDGIRNTDRAAHRGVASVREVRAVATGDVERGRVTMRAVSDARSVWTRGTPGGVLADLACPTCRPGPPSGTLPFARSSACASRKRCRRSRVPIRPGTTAFTVLAPRPWCRGARRVNRARYGQSESRKKRWNHARVRRRRSSRSASRRKAWPSSL